MCACFLHQVLRGEWFAQTERPPTLPPEMNIDWITSATVIVEYRNTRILCDPWLLDGAYFGSWHHWPPLEWRDLDFDYIYVSHIHPDHCHRATMLRLPKRPVFIANYREKYLKAALEAWGFPVVELDGTEQVGDIDLSVFLADGCDPALCGRFIGCALPGGTWIDSVAEFRGDERIVNTNDAPYGLVAKTGVLERLRNPDLLLVGYAGAGPYPQCFPAAPPGADLVKQAQFLSQAQAYVDHLEPAAYAPFAGQYVLAGDLVDRNAARGVPEPQQVHLLGAERVLFSDTSGLDKQGYLESLRDVQFPYQHWDHHTTREQLDKARARMDRARARYDYEGPPFYVQTETDLWRIPLTDEPLTHQTELRDEDHTRIQVPDSLLHMLTKPAGKYREFHWQNAEVGSHLTYYRQGDYDRAAHYMLNHFHA